MSKYFDAGGVIRAIFNFFRLFKLTENILRPQSKLLKYGFHKKSFILNATLVSCPFPFSLLGGFMSQIYGGEILQ